MKLTNRFFLCTLMISIFTCAQNKTVENTSYTYELIVPDLNNPWGFVFINQDEFLITEKSGNLLHVINGIKTEIQNLPEITEHGQGGLMDIELHPNYAQNGWLYLSYATNSGDGKGVNTAILRAKIKNGSLISKQVLYKATPNSTAGQHFGSRLEFDNEGYLYFSIGDRGNRDQNPQNITRDCGKIYRINDDGSIPSDNPFINSPNAKQAIYSYGHRNPQGMVKHPKTGAIWTHEHGPRGGDEINIIQSGKNYGWPKITYGKNYSGTTITKNTELPGMEQPLHYWTPSIAPSGMTFVTSDIYPKLKGNVLVGSLKFQYLNSSTIKNNKVIKEERLLDGIGRVRSVKQGPDGYIYVGVENLGIVKMIPKK